jgi:hypothetical protein
VIKSAFAASIFSGSKLGLILRGQVSPSLLIDNYRHARLCIRGANAFSQRLLNFILIELLIVRTTSLGGIRSETVSS